MRDWRARQFDSQHLGKPWNKPWFSQADIANGGTFVFTMGSEPNKTWEADARQASPSMSGQGAARSK